MPTFIGIDLAWSRLNRSSGGAVLRGDSGAVALVTVTSALESLSEIEAFVDHYSTGDTVVAVDAPLVIRNQHGQRACERDIGRRFWRAAATAHSTNLDRFPDARGVQLAAGLIRRGFEQCPTDQSPTKSGKWFFEVYPHPAQVVLFGRARIVKYKKGRLEHRRAGLSELGGELGRHLPEGAPALTRTEPLQELLATPLEGMNGRELKAHEDTLDAVFCAYMAAYFWTWSYERNEVFGSLEEGHIINPRVGGWAP